MLGRMISVISFTPISSISATALDYTGILITNSSYSYWILKIRFANVYTDNGGTFANSIAEAQLVSMQRWS
jgi:hypothetical protein